MNVNEFPECLADYEIEAELGNEGPAVVYRARQRSLDRVVALYLVRADEFVDEGESERFLRGARAAAQLDHPAIVRVYDVGGGDGWSYVATGLVEGDSLESKLAGRPVDVRHAVELVRRLAVAIAAAHKRNVVHGGLEPSSIRIDSNRQPRITGFGTAKLWSPDATLTHSGGRTSLYSAPELIGESSRSHYPSLDVYGLGGILYFALTGKPVFPQTSTAELVSIIAQQIPLLPSKLDPRVPPELDRICLTCLKKSPADRIASVSELADQLQHWLKGPSEVAVPASLQETIVTSNDGTVRSGVRPALTVRAFNTRSKITMAIGLATGLLLIGVVGWYWFGGNRKGSIVESGRSSTGAKSALPLPPLAVVPFSAAEALAHQKAWASYLGQEVALKNSIGMTLQLIPPGEFMMGATEEQIAMRKESLANHKKEKFEGFKKFMMKAIAGEQPQHHVRLSQPFYLSSCEITVGQFRTFVEETGYQSYADRVPQARVGAYASGKIYDVIENMNWRQTAVDGNDSHPVGLIGWLDAESFCRWLSKKEKVTYRLPTEAEWEFACRAGTTGLCYCGYGGESLRDRANVPDQSLNGTTLWSQGGLAWHPWDDGYPFSSPVGSFPANPFGLHDMIGNQWELCSDWFQSDYFVESPKDDPLGPSIGKSKVIRGGSYDWLTVPEGLTSTCRIEKGIRNGEVSEASQFHHGFRVVRQVLAPLEDSAAQQKGNYLIEQAQLLLGGLDLLKSRAPLSVSLIADQFDTAEHYSQRATELLPATELNAKLELLQNRIKRHRQDIDKLRAQYPPSRDTRDFPRHHAQRIDWDLLGSYSSEKRELDNERAAVEMENLFISIGLDVLSDEPDVLRTKIESFAPHAVREIKYWLTRLELWETASKRPEANRLIALTEVLNDGVWEHQFHAARTSVNSDSLLILATEMRNSQPLADRVLMVEALAVRRLLDRLEGTKALDAAIPCDGDPSYVLWPYFRKLEVKLSQLVQSHSNSAQDADETVEILKIFIENRKDMKIFEEELQSIRSMSNFHTETLP